MADILVIDDDPIYRISITKILTNVGHQVSQAKDGAEGLALCRQMRPALVITAIVMPEKDGSRSSERCPAKRQTCLSW